MKIKSNEVELLSELVFNSIKGRGYLMNGEDTKTLDQHPKMYHPTKDEIKIPIVMNKKRFVITIQSVK